MRHPAGSIQSHESADRALAEAVQQRAIIEDRFARDQRDCYPKFFTTSCLDDAKERRRIALGQVRAVEVEANTYKRRARVLERDKALAERRAQEESEAPLRMKAQPEAEASAANKASASGPEAKAGNAASASNETANKPARRHEAKRKSVKTAEQIDAKKRAENIAEYDKKVQDATARQREIAARKAEKERDKERQTTGKELPALPATGVPATGK